MGKNERRVEHWALITIVPIFTWKLLEDIKVLSLFFNFHKLLFDTPIPFLSIYPIEILHFFITQAIRVHKIVLSLVAKIGNNIILWIFVVEHLIDSLLHFLIKLSVALFLVAAENSLVHYLNVLIKLFESISYLPLASLSFHETDKIKVL